MNGTGIINPQLLNSLYKGSETGVIKLQPYGYSIAYLI